MAPIPIPTDVTCIMWHSGLAISIKHHYSSVTFITFEKVEFDFKKFINQKEPCL